MIKKSMPLILILFIFAVFLSYAIFDRTKKSNDSSLENNSNRYIEKDISTSSMNTTNKVNSTSKNENSYKNTSNIIANDTQVVKEQSVNNEIPKVDIDTFNYLNSLQCISYKLKSGETLTDIARKYVNICNLNATIKMIKSINKIDYENNINSKTLIYIPEYAIKSGNMYKVSTGDTWYKVANEYYPKYTAESIMKFLVYINNLPNNDLPLGETIFLPSV